MFTSNKEFGTDGVSLCVRITFLYTKHLIHYIVAISDSEECQGKFDYLVCEMLCTKERNPSVSTTLYHFDLIMTLTQRRNVVVFHKLP